MLAPIVVCPSSQSRTGRYIYSARESMVTCWALGTDKAIFDWPLSSIGLSLTWNPLRLSSYAAMWDLLFQVVSFYSIYLWRVLGPSLTFHFLLTCRGEKRLVAPSPTRQSHVVSYKLLFKLPWAIDIFSLLFLVLFLFNSTLKFPISYQSYKVGMIHSEASEI